jgi:hypothetical protein
MSLAGVRSTPSAAKGGGDSLRSCCRQKRKAYQGTVAIALRATRATRLDRVGAANSS